MAVYTTVTEAEAGSFLAEYSIGDLVELVPIRRGVSNTNYFLTTNEGRYVLTLYESRTNPKDLPFFIALMEHLAKRGVSCPKPVRGNDGEPLRTLNGKPAAIVTLLAGTVPSAITPRMCHELGRELGRMHNAGADFPMSRPNSMGARAMPAMMAECLSGADDVRTELGNKMRAEMERIQTLWPSGGLPTGIIHADMFPDNALFDDDGSIGGLIDFYFACNDYLAYDLAIAMNAWCFEHNSAFNLTKSCALFSGYSSARKLNEEEIAAMPVLARAASMRFLLSRLQDWLNRVDGATVTVKNPVEYLARLEFHQQVSNASAYGLAA